MNDDVWARYVLLTIVALAATAAFAAHKSAVVQSQVVLHQAQASDTWAAYQAKTTRQRLADMEARRSSGEEAARAAMDATRSRAEEKELQARAQQLETERDAAIRRVARLGFAIGSLQIAIAVAAASLIARRKMLWAASGILGVLGFSYLVSGWL
jgi:hypothetical protein